MKETNCEINCSIKYSNMQRIKKTKTHENPQNTRNKKKCSKLGCGKRGSPNHLEKRDVSMKTKRLKTN
jgi:hypothetical protein